MKQVRRRIRRVKVRGEHIDRVEYMLVNREQDLWDLGFWVNFKFLLDVIALASQCNCAGGGVFDDVRLS